MPRKPQKFRILLREPGIADPLEVKSFAHLADALLAAKKLRAFVARRKFATRVLVAQADEDGELHVLDAGE